MKTSLSEYQNIAPANHRTLSAQDNIATTHHRGYSKKTRGDCQRDLLTQLSGRGDPLHQLFLELYKRRKRISPKGGIRDETGYEHRDRLPLPPNTVLDPTLQRRQGECIKDWSLSRPFGSDCFPFITLFMLGWFSCSMFPCCCLVKLREIDAKGKTMKQCNIRHDG